MRTVDALSMLKSLRPDSADIEAEFGTRRDAAYLRIQSRDEPGRWAVISTPGDRWFSLEVDGQFSLDHFEEDTPDDEALRVLNEYLRLAIEYLHGGGTAKRIGWFRASALALPSNGDEVILRRSAVSELRNLVRFRRL